MRAILLAAGFGTRLRPLTDTIPKCLVPINGRPLLDIWLDNLSRAGIGPFLVNTHYLSEQVEAYVRGSRFRNAVTLVHEPTLLGTAGTLLANADFLDGGDGLLLHADNYCKPDFAAFAAAHRARPQGCVMTMMTFRTATPSSCGIVELDERGVVVGFHEKSATPPGNLANGAIYLLSDEMLRILRADYGDAADLSTEILPHFVGRIFTYETSSFFLDIGTPATYAQAQREGAD
ncbi:nucleotidyltransferase family protein [Pseudodesulfovibrio sp.]|uniref:nucleotidyltransferase family protein n=1 Tax=Pseudodesulfovibrio sp. TaxID=2035812 RepID=UPI0026346784|nr:nucleotidyltransferase family protein [Pseudodesulfovibrio sp.]MDD3312116.1 nucleotidyltransferase family protein [Pseudodesulfovibrio sp.]